MCSFLLAGAFTGLCLGILEGALLFFIPRATGLVRPDVSYVVWFIAPLVDLVAGGIVGLALGLLSSLRKPGATASLVFAAIGAGLAGAYVAWMLDWFGIGAGVIFPRRIEPRTAGLAFLIVFIIVLILTALRSRWKPAEAASRPMRRWVLVDVIALAILIAGVIFYSTHRPFAGGAAKGGRQTVSSRANVALIVLDTVRADHLSCYGYSRPTTPSICALAARGVLFEDAIAPSSWTLPSLTSIFTGLMPHQTGANWGRAPDPSAWPLARILSSKGYETAGFNANPFYGLSGWRLSDGFHVYEDDSVSLRHNLAVTFVGQSVLRFLYNHLVRYNQFDRRDAADVNENVERWASLRDTSRPYFLFINYMDAHRPYLPPQRFDHRFGRIPKGLLARVIQPLDHGHPHRPYSAAERQDLIDGYDNSLAYLDAQVGRLVDVLRAQPGGGRTIFIITSDHGEGFGGHGTYDHGWNLYREVLHVPLIIAGPGIPTGVRVRSVVPSRELFSTVLDFTLGLEGAVRQTSLRQLWEPSQTTAAQLAAQHGAPTKSSNVILNEAKDPALAAKNSRLFTSLRMNRARGNAPSSRGYSTHGGAKLGAGEEVVSELDVYSRGVDPASLSLTTPEWQLILSSSGSVELYNLMRDPGEKTNVASNAALQDVVANLRAELEGQLAYSLLPWRATDYLAPLDEPGASFIARVSAAHANLPADGLPIGAAQAVFSHQRPSQLVRPSPAQQEILRSLPYH